MILKMPVGLTIKRLWTRQFFTGSFFLVIGTLLVFGQVRHFDFTNFDDPHFVFENPMVKDGLSFESVLWGWKTGYYDFWHPLTWWSHMLDCELFGLNAGYHHLVNVFWHTANSIILFGLLAGMTGKWFRSFLVGALFALHPLHVESVAWVSERKDVLSTFFGLLSLAGFWVYTQSDAAARKQRHWAYGLSLAFFVLGLMAKAMLVTLPFVLLLLDFWPLDRIARNKLQMANLKPLLVEKLPYFALAFAACFMTYQTMSQGGNIAAGEKVSLGLRLENVPISYARYLLKLLWPSNLAAYYPMPKQWEIWQVIASVILLAVVSWLVVKNRLRFPYLFWGWLFFAGTLVPVIGIVANGFQAIADRYAYIPSIGIFVAVVWSVGDWLQNRMGRITALVLSFPMLGILGWMAWQQTAIWQNSFTLWSHCLQVTDASATAENNLGYYYWCAGEPGLAIKHYEAAVAVQPDSFGANINLGVALTDAGNYNGAINCFSRALDVLPESLIANIDMGMALIKAEDFNGAVKYCQKAVELAPADISSLTGLGRAQAALNQHEQAVQSFQRVLQLDSHNAEIYFRLGKEWGALGNHDEEIANLSQAASLSPNWVEAQFELALAYAGINHEQQAVEHYRQALAVNPDYLPALNNLAWILATSSNQDLRNGGEAVQLADLACKLTADKEVVFVGTLAAAYAEAGKFDEAVATANRACDLAIILGQTNLLTLNQSLRDKYKRHIPHRE